MKRIVLIFSLFAMLFAGNAMALPDPPDGEWDQDYIDRLVDAYPDGLVAPYPSFEDLLGDVGPDDIFRNPVGGILIGEPGPDMHICDIWIVCYPDPTQSSFRFTLDAAPAEDPQTYQCCADPYVPEEPVQYVSDCHDGYWNEWEWVEGNC